MKNPLNNVSYFMAVLVKVNLSRIKVHQREDPISWQLSNFLVKVNFEEELMVKECLYYY
jgi:hypothetical protein